MLDGMGGFAAYGLIENLEDQKDDSGIPICIAEQMKLKNFVGKDQKISISDIEFDRSDPAYTLYLEAIKAVDESKPASVTAS